MMEKAKEERELTPLELWDQLAVTQISKLLAPKGYKKIISGKVEVANVEYLAKGTVLQAGIMTANSVRLFRELLREEYEEHKKQFEKDLVELREEMKVIRFYQFKRKKRHREFISRLEHQLGAIKEFLKSLNNLKPAAPKAAMQVRKKPVGGVVKKSESKTPVIDNGEKIITVDRPKIVGLNGQPISSK